MIRFIEFLIERRSVEIIKPSKERAYSGKQEGGKTPITKNETGAIGEKIVMHHLIKTGHKGVHALNSEKHHSGIVFLKHMSNYGNRRL